MMKWLCILLLLANVGYFGWELNRRIYGDTAHAAPSPPRPLPEGVQHLKLLAELKQLPETRNQANTVAEAAPVDDATPAVAQADSPSAAAPQAPLATAEPVPIDEDNVDGDNGGTAADAGPTAADEPSSSSVASTGSCLSVGPFKTEDELAALRRELSGTVRQMQPRTEERQERKHFWVYLEPLESDARAEERLRELRNKGVEDLFLVRKGEMKNAISLGVFRSQESVANRLAEIKDRGYQPLVVPRYEAQTVYWLDLAVDSGSSTDALEGKLPPGVSARSAECAQIAAAAANQ